MALPVYVASCDVLADRFRSGPHHGHYVAIVKGPQSWLLFDDDKIESIKENEIPKYFGDATSGSAYVLYYQAVDLDRASLGIKTPAQPAVPDITVVDSPANETATNGALSLETPDLTLPPGLGESSAPLPTAAATVHPPIPVAPSSPSLVTTPLVDPITPPSRKKSLPSIRIPGTTESSAPSVTTPSRGLFHSLRGSPSHSKIRPSTSDGIAPLRSASEDVPPVPPVPPQFINGKEGKEKEKGGEKEREEERSSKEFDLKPSLWFRLRSVKPTKDDREKEKEKESKGKDKDSGSAPAFSAVPSQSDGMSSVSGASSIWRRSSARVGYRVKRHSATHSSTTLGEADAAAASLGPSSSPSHPHHHHHHHHHEPTLSAVPATPQGVQVHQVPSTPSSTSSSPALRPTPASNLPSPLTSSANGQLPSLPSRADGDAGTPGSPSLPAWYISPASPPGQARVALHTKEPASMLYGSDHDRADDASGDHLHAPVNHSVRPRRRRPHSVHGSGSGTPRERSTSPPGVPSPQSASGAESGGGTASSLLPDTSADGTSSSSASATAAVKLRRGARKLSLTAPLLGLGLGLGFGGRDRDRDHQHQHQHHHHFLGKKEDGKRGIKLRPPSSFFGSGSSTAPVSSSVP